MSSGGYAFHSGDGLVHSNNPRVISIWDRVAREQAEEEADWITWLRLEGVKAAHPDDGWVRRSDNSVQLVYPQFDDGLTAGDLLALGWQERWRIVRVIRTGVEGIISRHARYWFEEA